MIWLQCIVFFTLPKSNVFICRIYLIYSIRMRFIHWTHERDYYYYTNSLFCLFMQTIELSVWSIHTAVFMYDNNNIQIISSSSDDNTKLI